MSDPVGAGPSPLGVAAYGYGTPAEAPVPGGLINRGSDGKQYGSPALSLETGTRGQYVFDEFGRRTGMQDVRHMIILALSTVRGSCVVQTLGHRFRELRKVTDQYPQEQKTRVEEALEPLVQRKLISIDDITVEPRNGQPAVTRVLVTDLSNGTVIEQLI